MKKTIGMLLTMLFIVIVCTTYVNAGNVSIRAVNSNVAVGQYVSITVSFGEKVSIAQFKLSYDTTKLDYQNCSIGEFGTSTNTYVYVNSQDENVLESVTLKFRAKAAGSVTFGISGVVLSGDASISNATAKVVIKETTTSNKAPTTSPTPSNNQEEDTTLDENKKKELNELESILSGLNKEDYTEESWNKLQEIIVAAQNATTDEEYEAIKSQLDINSLKKVSFDKEELKKVLIDLLDKSKNDYTEESWNELKELIKRAESTDLKSEYDEIKDKLTIDGLVLANNNNVANNDFENFLNENKTIIIITLVSINAILIILSICILINTKRKNKLGR